MTAKPQKVGKLFRRNPAKRAKQHGVHDWWAAAEEMRRDPGEWYLVHRSVPRSTSTRIRQGIYTAFRPPTDWEVYTRGQGPRVRLYMAFVGAPGAKEKLDRNTYEYPEQEGETDAPESDD